MVATEEPYTMEMSEGFVRVGTLARERVGDIWRGVIQEKPLVSEGKKHNSHLSPDTYKQCTAVKSDFPRVNF